MTVHIYQPRRGENISLKRSRVVLRPRFHDLFTTAHVWRGLVTMDTRQRRNLLFCFPFIPPEVGGFLNSAARTAAPAKGRKMDSGCSDKRLNLVRSSPEPQKHAEHAGLRGSACLWRTETGRTYLGRTQQGPEILHRRLDLCLVQKDLGVDPAH